MTDHQHLFLVGDPHCRICYERQDAPDVNPETLADVTARALALLKDEIARIEDEADDRMMKAEYHARMQDLRGGDGAA